MSASIQEAARRMRAVLEAENAALRALDAAHVAALLDEKIAAARALAAAAGSVVHTHDMAVLGHCLKELAEENTRLLERAILVQSRVVELVARAARRADRTAIRYGAAGQETREGGGLALVTRA